MASLAATSASSRRVLPAPEGPVTTTASWGAPERGSDSSSVASATPRTPRKVARWIFIRSFGVQEELRRLDDNRVRADLDTRRSDGDDRAHVAGDGVRQGLGEGGA